MYLSESRYAELLVKRAHYPGQISELARNLAPSPRLIPGQKLLILAADHPARGMIGVGNDPTAMANRRDLLERIITVLRHPGVDGLLATPDLMEDLLVLGELGRKLLFGSMNRGGLAGSVWELDDRFTSYDPESIGENGLTGGKVLLRLDLTDPNTLPTLERTAQTINQLSAQRRFCLVEPLPVKRDPAGRVSLLADNEQLIRVITVASGLGNTSAYTWLKLPPPADPERVFAATTLPVLMLGGDPSGNPDLLSQWKRCLAVPNVLGLIPGRSLLYPQEGTVSEQIDRVAELVHG